MGDGLLRRTVPVLRRRDEQAGGELIRAGLRKEGIDVGFGHRAFGVVELALDSAQLARLPLTGHEVDATVQSSAPAGPVGPHPHLVEALGVAGIRQEELAHEALEARALATLGPRLEVQVVQDRADALLAHGMSIRAAVPDLRSTRLRPRTRPLCQPPSAQERETLPCSTTKVSVRSRRK
mgnify:FL=1